MNFRFYPYINFAALFLMLMFSLGCGSGGFMNTKEYFNYLSNPANGLVKEKKLNGIRMRVVYLPPEYLAFQTIDNEYHSRKYKDSVCKSFENSVTFIFTIGPGDNENFDITRVGVYSYEEFAGRIQQMAFEIGRWMSLTIGDEELKPSIAKIENINALERSRNFIVVFNSEKIKLSNKEIKKICYTFSDELFDTGTSKFVFNLSDIKEVPVLKF